MGEALEDLGFARWPPTSSSVPSTMTKATPAPGTPKCLKTDEAGRRSLSKAIKQLSLDTPTATPLPPSPQAAFQRNHERSTSTQEAGPSASYARVDNPRPSALYDAMRKTSMTPGGDRRSTTPILHKKSSMSSVRGGLAGDVNHVTPSRSLNTRRSSQNLRSSPSSNTASPRFSLPGVNPQPTTMLPPSEAAVASACLQAELERHREIGARSKTVVILQDSCYGHRYSRPKTNRASLSTIVERPERIHATVLGISAAYVRLGGRHVGGRHPPRPKQNPSLLGRAPFRIQKCSRLIPLASPIVTLVHGTKWMDELTAMCEAAEARLALNGKELVRPGESRGASSPNAEAKPKLHEGDLYLCKESLEALEGCIGAVCEGVDAVFEANENATKRAFVAIRPPGHHCSSNYPSGFCWLNNVHVGIARAALTHGLTHAAIIDFDLHHGDGSQSIAWDHNARIARSAKNAPNAKRASIGYFSLHDINSYPCESGDEEKVQNASLCLENAHGQTIWNVHLQPWKGEAEFWELYQTRYCVLIEKARIFLRTHTQRLMSAMAANAPSPKAAIFLSAGFDASEWESAGMQRHKVNVPTDFYARLTRDIVKLAEEEGLGVDGRIISVLEGGYSDRALTSGVLSHLSGLASTYEGQSSTRTGSAVAGLGYEMGKRIGLFDDEIHEFSGDTPLSAVDQDWWSPSNLEELELLVNPAPAPPSKANKPRNSTPPTYSSPTQSFTAKINISSPMAHRSISSGSFTARSRAPSFGQPARPLTPPAPDVSWAVAAHELSKLLVPIDRVTRSCRPEELAVEVTRAKKAAQIAQVEGSELHVPNGGKRMTLRDRKSRTPTPAEKAVADLMQATKVNRRKTVAGPAVIAACVDNDASVTPIVPPSAAQVQRQRRRSSAVSSTSSMEVPKMPAIPIGTAARSDSRISGRPGSPSSVTTGVSAARIPSSTGNRPIATMGVVATTKKAVKARAPAQPRPVGKKRITSTKPAPLRPKPTASVITPSGPQTIALTASTSSSVAPSNTKHVSEQPTSSTAATTSSSTDPHHPTTIIYPTLPSSISDSKPPIPHNTKLPDPNIDLLASNLKSIKLNVPTREEYEARQRDKQPQHHATLIPQPTVIATPPIIKHEQQPMVSPNHAIPLTEPSTTEQTARPHSIVNTAPAPSPLPAHVITAPRQAVLPLLSDNPDNA